MTDSEVWAYTGKLQLVCHSTCILMIVLGCKLVPKGSETKGGLSSNMVRKSLQTLFSMFTDPLNYTAMDCLYNAVCATYKKDVSV